MKEGVRIEVKSEDEKLIKGEINEVEIEMIEQVIIVVEIILMFMWDEREKMIKEI